MYITGRYWDNYIGGTDDSLTLVEYLASKQKEEIPLSEIFSDIGLDKLNGEFRQQEEPLVVSTMEEEADCGEPYLEFYFAINLITDLAALLLECKVNKTVNLCELAGDGLEADVPNVHITATPEEHQLINKAIMDFISEPLAYNLSEMCPEEDMMELAGICENLRKELYGQEG